MMETDEITLRHIERREIPLEYPGHTATAVMEVYDAERFGHPIVLVEPRLLEELLREVVKARRDAAERGTS